MTPVVVEPRALADLDEAFVYYEGKRVGLGSELLDEFAKVSDRIAEFPTSYPVFHRNARRALMDRFPYLVLFVELDERITIIGVFHGARNPYAIRRRVTDR